MNEIYMLLQMMAVYLLLLLVFGGVSLLLYLLTMAVVVSHRGEFRSSFYTIFISRGIADCLQVLVNYSFFRFPAFGVLPTSYATHDWFPSSVLFVSHALLYSQLLGVLLLNLNRYTAVVWPLHYERAMRLCIAVQWTLPVVYAFNRHFQFAFYYRNDDNTYFIGMSWKDFITNTTMTAIAASLVNLLCLALSVSSIVAYIRTTRHSPATLPLNEKRHYRIEANLLLFAFIIFTTLTLLTIYEVLIAIFASEKMIEAIEQVNLHYFWIVDLFSLTSPWLIYFSSSVLRSRVNRSVGVGRCSTRTPHALDESTSMMTESEKSPSLARLLRVVQPLLSYSSTSTATTNNDLHHSSSGVLLD